ncbi:hypothetical protein DSECCO2_580940 [anaerobic digester metagenome]
MASAKTMAVVSNMVPSGANDLCSPIICRISNSADSSATLSRWLSMTTTQLAIRPIRESFFEVMRQTLPPISFAVSDMSATVLVAPDPEKTMMTSPGFMAGVTVSPTTNAESPRCIKRMANDFATRPERPAPMV